ncbi:hypothetical protein ACHAWC_002698 [Mediolabrus comicus]
MVCQTLVGTTVTCRPEVSSDEANSVDEKASSPTQSNAHLPASFYCPLTMSIMKNPVQDREGNSYEAAAIKRWLEEGNLTSPITRNSLLRKHLVPNRALRCSIEYFRNRNPSVDTDDRTILTIINCFLSSHFNSKLDEKGIVLIPMATLYPKLQDEDTMVVEVPRGETFKFYTYLAIKNKRLSMLLEVDANISEEDNILHKLLKNGSHKSLKLTKVNEEKMLFEMEGKVSSIISQKVFKNTLVTFIKVVHRLQRKLKKNC